jgi:hypothetical protein
METPGLPVQLMVLIKTELLGEAAGFACPSSLNESQRGYEVK